MNLILISIFLILTTSTMLAVYNYIEICKLKIGQKKEYEHLLTEHKRDYEHLLNNVKNIDNFLKHEK